MPEFRDQIGRAICINSSPKKIVSTVPSQSELLYDLGLENEIAGVTAFCVHPAKLLIEKQKIGGTKKIDIQLVKQLDPDLVVAGKEENIKAQIEELGKYIPVWTSDVRTLKDAQSMINSLGEITGREEQALAIQNLILQGFERLATPLHRRSAAYLVWRKPYMAAGGDTFISDMMSRCGFMNIFKGFARYPSTSPAELQQMNPEVLLLPSEPFRFTTKHVDELHQELPGTQIILVNGEMFSWYGSRLIYAPRYFRTVMLEMEKQ
ncbi:MAG TPA: helical backbone metal receptor [Puia sp.]|nr:helical backbone metal receptor [Puia sp.]